MAPVKSLADHKTTQNSFAMNKVVVGDSSIALIAFVSLFTSVALAMQAYIGKFKESINHETTSSVIWLHTIRTGICELIDYAALNKSLHGVCLRTTIRTDEDLHLCTEREQKKQKQKPKKSK
jgi:hypothetical protein